MPVSYYETVTDQLRADWEAVLPGAVVRFGSPRRPITTFPQVINTVRRVRGFGEENSGVRSPVERFEIETEVRIAVSEVGEDWESDLNGIVDRYINLVTGGTSTEPAILAAKVSAPYAGVCHSYEVTDSEPILTKNEDPYVAVQITSSFETQVYQ